MQARVYENGGFPIYQIGLDAYHTDANPAPILYLYPYMEWINQTIIGNTKNTIIIPQIRGDEKKKWIEPEFNGYDIGSEKPNISEE